VFLNKQHGSIVWGIRLLELPPAMAAKNDSWVVTGVVQGPTEAGNMHGILEPFDELLQGCDPGNVLSYLINDPTSGSDASRRMVHAVSPIDLLSLLRHMLPWSCATSFNADAGHASNCIVV